MLRTVNKEIGMHCRVAMYEAVNTAAQKRELSPENTRADKPLSSQTSKPQKEAAAERMSCSPKDAFSGKLFPAGTPNSHKQVFTEKRGLSPENTVDD
jgi:hypothetical protein